MLIWPSKPSPEGFFEWPCPYAKALADELVRPGVESILVFTRVAHRVYQEIGQNPYMSASTMPEIYFAGSEGSLRPTARH